MTIKVHSFEVAKIKQMQYFDIEYQKSLNSIVLSLKCTLLLTCLYNCQFMKARLLLQVTARAMLGVTLIWICRYGRRELYGKLSRNSGSRFSACGSSISCCYECESTESHANYFSRGMAVITCKILVFINANTFEHSASLDRSLWSSHVQSIFPCAHAV